MDKDKRELEKYIKFLALKVAQVVVQSRLGEKIYTQCYSTGQNNQWVGVSYFCSFLFCMDFGYLTESVATVMLTTLPPEESVFGSAFTVNQNFPIFVLSIMANVI